MKKGGFLFLSLFTIIVVLVGIAFLVYLGALDIERNNERIDSRQTYTETKEMECKELCSPDKYFFSISNSYQIITCECH